MTVRHCKKCGSVVVKRHGTALEFKTEAQLFHYADTDTFAGRCRSCGHIYKVTWQDMIEPQKIGDVMAVLMGA